MKKLINLGIPIICVVLLSLMIVFTFLQIVLRQFSNFSLSWSDEVSQFCMSWLTLFGSIWVTKNDQHINAGLKLHRKLNQRQICLIDGILAFLIAVIAAVVACQSTRFAFMSMSISSLSLNWLKMGYIFIALPLAMLAVFYYYLKSFFKNFACVFKKK
jgi:TRAP-type C4-dicarboxylate transport system permease small subunit